MTRGMSPSNWIGCDVFPDRAGPSLTSFTARCLAQTIPTQISRAARDTADRGR